MTEPRTAFRRSGHGRPAPRTVRWAVYLLGLAAVLGLVSGGAGETSDGSASRQAGGLIGGIVGALLIAVFARQLSFGRSWSRWVAWAIGSLSVVLHVAAATHDGVATGTLDLSGAAVYIVASVLLATPASSDYFGDPPGGYDHADRSAAAPGRARELWWVAGLMAALAIAGLVIGLTTRTSRPGVDAAGDVPEGTGVAHGRTVASSGGSGTTFRSTAAHFAARFTNAPILRGTTQSRGGFDVEIHTVVDTTEGTFVLVDDVEPGLPATGINDFLAGQIKAQASGSGYDLTNEKLTTFQGRRALAATESAGGISFAAVAVAYGTQRFYLLGAPSSTRLAALEDSFIALP